MKNIFFVCAILLLSLSFTNLSYAQNFEDNGTYTLNLEFADCKYAKGKVLGEKVRLDIIVDGYETIEPLSKSLKTGRTWSINYSYDFIDYIIIKIWDDNVFKDHLIGELRIDRNMIDQNMVVPFNSEKVAIDFSYRVIPGPGLKAIIMRLRQSISSIARELKYLRKENKNLNDEVKRLRDHNENLLDKITDLKKK